MACASCSCGTDGSKSLGCNKNGGCATGGCNKMNTFDWLSTLDIEDPVAFNIVEVSFKNGARKDFYHNPEFSQASSGDMVVVEAPSGGYDIGRVNLTGDLVRLQMKKKKQTDLSVLLNVIRKANERDLERLEEARNEEKNMLVKARAIARTLGLDMKIGDIEHQGDMRKATFFYTADGRVDFRELIRHYAKDFKVKIEMRQIGARQESARVGGIGSCGRELCCSTWLADFKSVSTAAARYQNLAINQAKLSGQCGRLKCCLNYELDAYIDALQDFPEKAERLQTKEGMAFLIKTDVFKRIMIYVYDTGNHKGKFITMHVDQVKKVVAMNKKGELPVNLDDLQVQAMAKLQDGEPVVDYEDVTGAVELPEDRKKKNNKNKNRNRNKNRNKNRDKNV
jgi:cell fate regulator YaaT (PSP1 superfamily)